MAFHRRGIYLFNISNMCYYTGKGNVNMIEFGNHLLVTDEEALNTFLFNMTKSKKHNILKIEDGERQMYINLDIVNTVRYALKGMILTFPGHTLQLFTMEAILKVLKKIEKAGAYVGGSGYRDSTE